MTLEQYINNVNAAYKRGNATEHTYRGDLKYLIESIVSDVAVTNEPKRQSCGAPDYILSKKDNLSRSDIGIPVGFIEAKDIGDKDLEGAKKTGNKEQFDRYKASLNNLIFTDYLDFHLYRDGEFVTKIAIAASPDSSKGGEIVAIPENFSAFTNLIKDFCSHTGQTIKSSKKLAQMMAGKARLLSDIIGKALISDQENQENSTLKEQLLGFKQVLIHDITPQGFADVYAQTIAYGMFAARLHDPTLPTFSREEAATLIPKTNPFLRKLFQYIAGYDLDDRIKWVVDDLVQIFLACNVAEILKNYGKSTKMEDPIIHFYETFLSEYDPKLRKARGVWYTPHPVVGFQIRAIDDVLKTEFGLPQGIADNSKIKIKVTVQGKQVEQEVHRVQLLDPATGTGTYIAEVIKHIHKKFEGQQGIWSDYVENHLLPRLIGFELLMASYAMAHLQIDLLLTETGYTPSPSGRAGVGFQRLKIYLTNSLEESHPDTGTLFANWLSSEANEANYVKRDAPVMIVMGNPPYAVSSTNKNEWIQNLIADYKKDLNERKINLDDDYIKFIRYGQHFIDKNGSGILAYISNNSFLDGITHRQMRKHLLDSFDTIYILDLHGNSRKMEVCPDGSVDQNVFDIMAGVSINIFIKTGDKKKNTTAKVYQFDLQGKREFKYDTLNSATIKNMVWNELDLNSPNYFFVPKNFDEIKVYEKGFKLDEFFGLNNSGFETARDSFIIKNTSQEIKDLKIEIKNNSIEEIHRKYGLKLDKVKEVKNDIDNSIETSVLYRPFDYRFSLISKNSQGVMFRPRFETMKHLKKENPSLLCCKRQTSFDFQHSFITNRMVERCSVSLQTGEVSYVFPLYLYPETNGQQTIGQTAERTPNLNTEIVKQIAEKLRLTFTTEKVLRQAQDDSPTTFAPIDILDYIYAVLHSPSYREKYKEFLKIDFPRVPYPKDLTTFQKLSNLGSQIRQIHLLESPKVEEYITQYPINGDNVVLKPRFSPSPSGRAGVGLVYINESQYFDNVPQVAWDFYIGGYQPAQKWLKDRKGRKLEFEDIFHYQKIIVALTETDRLMKEIDEIEIE